MEDKAEIRGQVLVLTVVSSSGWMGGVIRNTDQGSTE